MNRTRRSSIVSSIASKTGGLDYQELPQLLDDSYLLNKLEKLALETGIGVPNDNQAIQQVEKNDPYDKYSDYLQELNSKVDNYETILQHVVRIQDRLKDAIETFDTISSNSNDFLGRTKGAFVEYGELSQVHENIPVVMEYFTCLDPIMRRLNHASSPNIVRKNSFNNMLKTIDQSLFFLEDHQDLVEAELYLIRFKRCLIRACELISNYVSGLLRQSFNDINQKLKASLPTSSSQVSREALVYNKFEQLAQEYYTRFAEIKLRADDKRYEKYHDELGAILNDCYEQYFQTRARLLAPIIQQHLDETTKGELRVPLVNFIQDSKTYFEKLCTDEFNLFVQFHGSEYTRERATRWLRQLCDPLYDSVRTRILKETDISILCDSVTLFGQYYQFEDDSEEYHTQFPGVQFDKIFEPIVQKLQARLILRVQIYIQQHIVGYVPSKDSFIISRRKKRLSQESESISTESDPIVQSYLSNISQDYSNEPDLKGHKLELYYPPLLRSLALLSKIYEMLNAAVFDDLAHHIVHDCILSLRKAYNTVNSSSGGSNNLDVKLSYLSNLLLLRQEIQNFNIQYTVNETYLDFSGVEAFFKSGGLKLRDRESSVFGMAKALVPKVVKNMVDARSELISELRNVIREFTEVASAQLVGNLLEIEKCDAETIVANNSTLRSEIDTKLPRIHAQISTFINDKDVITNLMDAIQEVITQNYSAFYGRVSEEAERNALDKSKISELMYDDVFADFVNNIVSRLTSRAGQRQDLVT